MFDGFFHLAEDWTWNVHLDENALRVQRRMGGARKMSWWSV